LQESEQLNLGSLNREILTLINSRVKGEKSQLVIRANGILFDYFDQFLNVLYRNKERVKIRQFLEDNLQFVIELSPIPVELDKNFDRKKNSWLEIAKEFAPELMIVLGDQGILHNEKQFESLFNEAEINKIKNYLQTINPDGVYEIFNHFRSNFEELLIVELSKEFEIINPPNVKDSNYQVQQEFDAAVQQQRKGNFDGALTSLMNALQVNPGNMRIKEWQGTLYIKGGNLLRAKRIFEHEIDKSWKSFTRDWNLAYIYNSQGNIEKAFNILSSAIEYHGQRATLLHLALELALKLKKDAFLLRNLSQIYQIEAAALGFILAYDLNQEELIENYMVKLDYGLSGNKFKLPPISQSLSISQVQKLAMDFINSGYIEAGILHFEDRIRRYKETGLAWALYRALGDLYNITYQYEDAIENYMNEFSETERNSRLDEKIKIDRLIGLLDYCKEHKLKSYGIMLLSKTDFYLIPNYLLDQYKSFFLSNIDESKKKNTSKDEIAQIEEPIVGVYSEKIHTSISDARNMLNENFVFIRRVGNLNELLENSEQINIFINALPLVFGDEANNVVHLASDLLKLFGQYNNQHNYEEKSRLAQIIIPLHRDFVEASRKSLNTEFQNYLDTLRKPMRHATATV
jgi:tetratricopeptide (TPR) repeat protein